MTEAFFENRIYYRTNTFEPNRMTLVFIHGVSGSSSAWKPYEKIFENKYNIVLYDIRGHGMSKKYPNYADYEIKNFANDLHELLTHLNISKFVLITNSFAALIAIEYLKSWQDTVMGNIFTSPEIYLHKNWMAKIARPILDVFTKFLAIIPFNPQPRGHVDYSKHIGSTDWDISRNFADMRNTGLRAHFYTLRQSLDPIQEYSLEKIMVPTLIIHGEKDSMVPLKNVIHMSTQIQNSQFVKILHVDHNTVHNSVVDMAKAIESFLETNKDVLH